MRIISLCPSLTELVFELGCGRDLLACTKFCVRPARGVKRALKIGGTKDPQIDAIVALSPDIVLMNEEENRREDHQALIGKGVACHSTMPRTIAETADMVRSIAGVLGRPERGEEIAIDIEQRAKRVAAAVEGRDPVSFAYMIWNKPWMSVNGDTFAHALLVNAGGVNIFGDHAERYPEVSLDELRKANPDIVLLCTEPFPFKASDALDLSSEIGIPMERIWIADGELLSWHGSRTPDGVDYALSLIAGE
jgi:ABC-type Fe3+-hydroxamate transport system substrate-binding protein